MTPSTLSFYSLTAGLCFAFSIVLLVYAHLQRGTLLIRSSANTFLMLAVAFFLSGNGPLFPAWVTVIGTNTLLLTASVVFMSGFKACLEVAPPRLDRIGIGLVVLAMPLFAWWGLVEPNGVMRSIVYSAVTAIMCLRIASTLWQLARKQNSKPALALGGLFIIASVWMLARVGVLLFAEPVPSVQRGDNPTTWVTVFWFNVLAAAMVAVVLMMEWQRQKQPEASLFDSRRQITQSNLRLLWTMVAVVCLTILTEVGIAYAVLYQREYAQLKAHTQLANQAFAEHSAQLIKQADILIRATHEAYKRKLSAPDLENLVQRLNFSRDFIENIYVIDADGYILVPQAVRALGRNATQRDFFQYHLKRQQDDLFISPVSADQITGKHQLNLSRALSDAQGRFAGVILVPIEPKAFTRLYERLLTGKDNLAALVGTVDRKIRARTPAVDDPKIYNVAIDNTPLWESLEKSAQGDYPSNNAFDATPRHFVYQRIGDWPLVMVNGFSIAHLRAMTLHSIQPIGLAALLALTIVFSLAFILSGVIRRRDEQESFTAMLVHELKTPLSVIRMAVGHSQLPDDSQARISRSLHAMDAVIERCQMAERINSGQITSMRTSIDPDALLRTLRDGSEAPERIKMQVAPLPDCSTDYHLLHTILTNLLDNALKYGKRDANIRLSARPESRKRRHGILFSVSNPPGPAGTVHLVRLRKKLSEAGAPEPTIKALRGKGYQLCVDIEIS